jgi:hypothetical protein
VFDDDELYRYDLVWRWRDGPLLVAWLLNPSTATHEVLDPTVRGMIARARGWEYAGLRVINLFGIRATKPADMMAHEDPVGPDNDLIIRRALIQAADDGSMIVAGWGRHGMHLHRESREGAARHAPSPGITRQRASLRR